MARLPQGTPAFHRAVAALVLEAWADDALREQLRHDPAATLAARELMPPEGTQVAIVPPAEATLPSAHRVVLPIGDPDPGDPSAVSGPPTRLTADEAHEMLARTEWRWLLLSPEEFHAEGVEGAVDAPISPVVAQTAPQATGTTPPPRRTEAWWRRLAPRAAAPAWALAGAVGVIALLVWGAAGDGLLSNMLGAGSGSTSGTAAGAPPWLWLTSAVAVVAALIWWSGRRGG